MAFKITSKFMLSLAVLLAVTTANAGGADVGGGNGSTSSAEEVKAAIDDSSFSFLQLVDFVAANPGTIFDPQIVTDPNVKKVLEAWFTTPSGEPPLIKGDLFKSKAVLLDHGPCENSQSEDRDASTAFHRGAEICFSVERLERVPNWALAPEILALRAHEYAHHFGFGEVEAQAVQYYVLRNYGIYRIERELLFTLGHQFAYFFALDVSLDSARMQQPAQAICRTVSKIWGMADALGVKAFWAYAPYTDSICFNKTVFDATDMLKLKALVHCIDLLATSQTKDKSCLFL